MDKQLIASSFRKAADSYHDQAYAQNLIAQKLASLLTNYHTSSTDDILEIGCGTGFLTNLLYNHYIPLKYVANDISIHENLKSGNRSLTCIEGDAEHVVFNQRFDIVASASTVQWFCDLPAFFNKSAELLRENGVMAISSFLPGNLKEVYDLTKIGLDYAPISQLKEWLSKDFTILHCSTEDIRMYFSDPVDVLKHMKNTGVTGINKQVWTKGTLRTFCEDYIEKYSCDEGVSLTYKPIYLIVQKKSK